MSTSSQSSSEYLLDSPLERYRVRERETNQVWERETDRELPARVASTIDLDRVATSRMSKRALDSSSDEGRWTLDSHTSDSDSGPTRPPPLRRRRTRAGGAPVPRAPTGPKRSLPEAGPFNPHYVVSPRRAGRDRVTKDLNLLQNYGDYWPREAGLRELVQNMWDGCMNFCHGSPDDIVVSVLHMYKDGEGPAHDFDWGILDPTWSKNLEMGETITVIFRLRDSLEPPSLPQPVNLTRLERKGDCGIWSDSHILGWLSLRAAARDTFEIELFNVHKPLTLSKMRFGATTKARSRVLVGQHGDGLKMGINAIIREGTANGGLIPNLYYFTGSKQWEFEYNEAQDLSLEVLETVAITPFVPGILVRIVDFPRNIVDLSHFLFVRPPTKCFTSVRGSILMDRHLSSRIYIKNFYVSNDSGLAYGVNIHDASLTRDRNSMYGESSSSLSAYVYIIWAAAFRSNNEALDLYLKLLLGKESCIDIRHAEGHGYSPMDVDDVKLLWARLQGTKGGGDVFFCSESPEDIRITRDVLRKTPFPIHNRFYSHLREHRLVQSPQEARRAKFLNLAASPIIAQPTRQVQYTLHLLASFLASESEMARYRDAYQFQAVPNTLDSIEVDKVDGEVLLINDCTLSSEFVHLKCGMCPYYRRHLHARSEPEPQAGDVATLFDDHRFPDVDAEHICHCAALHILSLMTQENSRVTPQWRLEAERRRYVALQTLPRDVRFQVAQPNVENSDAPVEMTLTWRTWIDNLGFLVKIYDDAEPLPRLLINATQVQGLPQVINPPSLRTFECNRPTLCLNDQLRLGRKYVAQICWNEKESLFSMPYHFCIPPSPPRSASVVVEQPSPDQLRISWVSSPADGADAWIVVIRLDMQEVVRREVNTPVLREGIDGLPDNLSDADILVEIHAKSTACDGLVSKNYASWSSHGTSYPLFSPLQEGFRDSESQDAPGPAFYDSEELEYVDNERSLALMAAMNDHDDGHDDVQMDVEEREVADQIQVNVGGASIPIYDQYVAKPSLSLIDDRIYIPVKSRSVRKKKLVVDKFFLATMKWCAHKVYIHIDSISVPEESDADGAAAEVVIVRQYIPRVLLHPNASSDEVLLVCYRRPGEEPADRARFLLSSIVDVHSGAISIPHLDVLARVEREGTRFCKWKAVFGGARQEFIPVIPPSGDSPLLTSLDFVDISCGIGGASLGFHEAGFHPRFGVEPEEVSSMLFERNCSTEVYNEPVDSFIERAELSEYRFGAVFVNCDSTKDGSAGVFIQSIRALKPAYALCALSPKDVDPKELDRIEHEAMDLGYGFKSQLLDVADFGVAVHRRYLLVIAAAPGRDMPSFPIPQENTGLALKDVIEDLTWDNAKCRPSNRGLATSFSHTVNQPHGVTCHCTGCYVPDFSNWDPATTIAEWDEPLADAFAVPSQNVKCRHPHHPERFLTVREMARILSFPDKCAFSGSLEKQYSQLANSVPPRFARAIAEEVRKLLVAPPTMAE